MRTFAVEYYRDEAIRLAEPLMSSEWNGVPVKITQTISGSHLHLTYGTTKYTISVERLAQSWLADVIDVPDPPPQETSDP